jgi:DNA-binding CsgD family transcriptional regulator
MALKPKQRELLEAMLAHPMMSDVKLAKLLGINNKTVGVWKKQDEFKAELDARLREQWKDSERIAQRTMIDLCAKGDFRASQYILNSLDYAPTQKIEADVNTNIEICVEE